jgi:hypothetical protein
MALASPTIKRRMPVNWTKFANSLEAAFTIPKVTLPEGQILGRRKTLNLKRLLVRAATSEDERGEMEVGFPWEVLDPKYHPSLLVEFEWESGGPMSWFSQVGLLDVGSSRMFAWVFNEAWGQDGGDAQRIVAALEPKDNADVTSTFFGSLIHRNGAKYGFDDIFGSLPSYTRNHRPDLIPVDIIKESYWQWMDWATRADRVSWGDLRDSVIHRAIDPSPLVDLGQLLSERANRSADYEQRELEDLSTEDRRRIFDNYFSLAYQGAQESNPR